MIYGYARVSSVSQDLTIQVQALKAAGCDEIRSEKVSGTSIQGRDELQKILEFSCAGDEHVCTRIARMARSVKDLQDIVRPNMVKAPLTPGHSRTPRRRNVSLENTNYHKCPGGSGEKLKVLNQMKLYCLYLNIVYENLLKKIHI